MAWRERARGFPGQLAFWRGRLENRDFNRQEAFCLKVASPRYQVNRLRCAMRQATCQGALARIAADLKGLGEYPSTKDGGKQLQAVVEDLTHFMRDSAD